MSSIAVSAVIPVYNGARFIAAAIDSCLGQSSPVLECIVVDDGSEDETADIISRFGAPVRLLQRQRGGVSAARNAGIAASRGTHIAFLDADDVWMAEKMRRQIGVLETGADAVICGFQISDRALKIVDEQRGAIPDGLRSLLTFDYGGVCGSSMVVSRAAAERLQGFDEALSTSADWDFLARLLLEFSVAVIPEALLVYRLHGANMHHDAAAMERDMVHCFSKIFADPRLDPGLKADERHCRAVLHKILAGSHYGVGNRRAAVMHLAAAASLHPAYAIGQLGRRASRLVRAAISVR
jgi:glycosyltransferase involved in cell wall biosynthesis